MGFCRSNRWKYLNARRKTSCATSRASSFAASSEPIWFAGPDVIASKVLSGKPPHIVRAVRLVPHGTQTGLKPTSLRGMVPIDPRRHDFFRHVVEQRQRHKKSDEPLAKFLKTLANAGSYGLFVEVTPEAQSKPTSVHVHSGNTSFDTPPLAVVERPGRWYFPPIAALITAGGCCSRCLSGVCVMREGRICFVIPTRCASSRLGLRVPFDINAMVAPQQYR